MNIVNSPCLSLIAGALVLGGGGVPAVAAQTEIVQPLSADADALSAEMRTLAANPNDFSALVRAGELALNLGDTAAAARFFARADKIDARNGRLKAGTARTLLLLERPGEALRLFDEAERLGYDPVHYAAERGLAFDLVGEQQRAQRDYRLALKQAPDDETSRRFALSLGISGRKDQALAQIDTLLRRSDRAAWRVRAFVLAMSGDVAGAEKIATSMLPPGMASGLMPFFAKLAALGPADRAFAVHFGEVAPTPARIADARLTPAYPPLPPEPQPVVRLAANPPPARDARADRRNRQARERDRPVQVAAAVVPPVLRTLPPAPPRPAPKAAPQPVKPQPTPAPLRAPAPPPVAQTVQEAARPEAKVAERPAIVALGPPAAPATTSPEPVPLAVQSPPAQTVASIAAPQPAPAAPAGSTAVSAVPAFTLAPPVRAAASLPLTPPEPDPKVDQAPKTDLMTPAPAPVVARAEPVAPPPAAPPPAEPTPVAATAALPAPAPDRPASPPVSAPEAAPARPVASEESILARIVASIAVPAAELGVPPVTAATRPSSPAANVPSATEADSAKAKPTPPVLSPEEKRAAAKAEAKKLADKKLADRKLAERQAADKRAAEEAAAAKKALKAEPSRVWVQVAGGANVADLPKEWTRLRGKAGALLQGRQSWTTPLRFTNRLLTGPFKSSDEAQAFVNQIAKSGITGFVFTSDAGQKIARLPAK